MNLNPYSVPHRPTVSYDDSKAAPTYASHRKAISSPSSVGQGITVRHLVNSSFRVQVDISVP
jgi:hypothetical protein